MLVMCTDRSAVMSVVELVFNQRLVRQLCPQCRGIGCDNCLRTGYKGCVPLAEWVRVDDALRARLRADGPGLIAPPVPLAAAARGLVEQGVTNEAEYRRVLGQ